MTHRQDKIRLGTVFTNDPKKVIDYPFGLNDVLGICCPFARVKYGAYAMWLATRVHVKDGMGEKRPHLRRERREAMGRTEETWRLAEQNNHLHKQPWALENSSLCNTAKSLNPRAVLHLGTGLIFSA
ncbi:unnamed protein product [Leuciscus chuanchicus]